MPQIDPDKHQEFISYLQSKFIPYRVVSKDPNNLKPTQANIHPDRVEHKLKNKSYNDKLIFTSKDDYIVDGHHAWMASLYDNADEINTLEIGLSILDCLNLSKQFSGVTYKQ